MDFFVKSFRQICGLFMKSRKGCIKKDIKGSQSSKLRKGCKQATATSTQKKGEISKSQKKVIFVLDINTSQCTQQVPSLVFVLPV